MNEEPTTLHTRNVPPNLKGKFKAYCAINGYTMEAAIVALMRKAIAEGLRLEEAEGTIPS